MSISWKVFLFALVTFSKTKAALEENGTGKVIFVNVLHRHGDRTPTRFYPTDPYKSNTYWPEGIGQLKNAGKKRVFELGQWLRRRYDSLLTEVYNSDTIYIQSTDKDRTLMSAQCNLAGMYPPKGAQVWSDDLAWQPIPVHTTPEKLDKVLAGAPKCPCPAYEKEYHRVFSSDEKFGELNQTYSELIRRTSENSGSNVTLLNLYVVYNALFVERYNNLTLPAWTRGVFPEPMRDACMYIGRLSTWTTKLKLLSTGTLLQAMIQNMVDKVESKTTRNVHVYSAHDETIMNLLNALGAFNDILPPYASCLMMELRVDSGGNHYVTLYYRNSTAEPYLLTVAGCDPVCPLDKFISISQPLTLSPEDRDKECGFSDEDHSSYLWIALIVIVTIAIVAKMIMLAFYYFCYWRKSR